MFRRLAVMLCLLLAVPSVAQDITAAQLVRKAVDQYRGLSSYAEMTMIIHRPEWERSMSMRAWTRGDNNTLVRVLEPRKDAGNGTLMLDSKMWTFAPKINRVIKVPSSMMGQNWMGSDFSNKDISKTTDIIDQYTHTIVEQIEEGDHKVYTIESIPHEDAAIVWGREVLVVRDDWILLEHQFWDQDGAMLKVMKASDIQLMSGRMVATKLRMSDVESPGQWTQMETKAIEFDLDLADNLFTLSNLRNPRQ